MLICYGLNIDNLLIIFSVFFDLISKKF